MRHQTTSFRLFEHKRTDGASKCVFKDLGVRVKKLLDFRSNLLPPFASIEDAVMADVLCDEIFLFRSWKPGGDVERGFCLAKPGYVIAFAFDCEKRRVTNGVWPNEASTMLHLTFGQEMSLEHDVDGLQVEFRSHVAH